MCALGLKVPYNGKPMKKRTSLVTNCEMITELFKTKKCACGDIPHETVLGKTWQMVDGVWKPVARSALAGGYTPDFAKTLLDCARSDIEKGTFPVDVFRRQREIHDMTESMPPKRLRRQRGEEQETREGRNMSRPIRLRLKRDLFSTRLARKENSAAADPTALLPFRSRAPTFSTPPISTTSPVAPLPTPVAEPRLASA